MKAKILVFSLLFFCNIIFTQSKEIDSLKHELTVAKHDTIRVKILAKLGANYREIKLDTSIMYALQALNLAQKINYPKGKAMALNGLGFTYRLLGNIPKSLELQFKGLRIAEENHLKYETVQCLRGIGVVYYAELNDNTKAIFYLQQAKQIHETLQNDEDDEWQVYLNLAITYKNNNQLDSSLFYFEKTRKILPQSQPVLFNFLRAFGDLQFRLGNHQKAIEYLHESIPTLNERGRVRGRIEAYNTLARFFKELNQPDSCIYFAKLGLAEAQLIAYKRAILNASSILAEVYESKDIKKSHKYLKIAKSISDELYGITKVQELQKIVFEEQERQRKVEAERIASENRLKQLALVAGLGIMFLIGFILYRNNRQKHKANIVLQEQKEKVESTLTQLKSTQAQLIQKEKLASLGELTAGIAHEIQNPLNFVNNFSELSVDLVKDLKDEMEKSPLTPEGGTMIAANDRAYINELFDDLSQNQEKINHHGKRASSIVKGMLEHSRASTGEREWTDINALADEYLRLSYHGLRAKDKNFNADYKTDFQDPLSKIEIIPQDIGRVLLNLINNAFYAVHQRHLQDPNHTPAVLVTTKQLHNQIIISVKDNGMGMSESVKAKIFQPFFTTKPTGEGTGLGLSLAYDIVTKGHGGTLEVYSKEGEGTDFIINLPLN